MSHKRHIITLLLGLIAVFTIVVVNVDAQLFVNTQQITDNDVHDQLAVLAVDGQDVIHFAWVRNNNLLLYMNSSMWQEVVIADNVYVYAPSIFIDDNAVVYVSWTDERDATSNDYYGNTDAYYAKSSDGWINQLVTAATDFRVQATSIAVHTDGEIHVTYIRDTDEYWYNQQVFYANMSGGWVETQVSDTPYVSIDPSQLSMSIDLNGAVHVAFSNRGTIYDPTQTEHIWYANSSSGWNNVQIDSDATTDPFDDRIMPTIDVDSNNIPHVVWTDGRNVNKTYPWLPNRRELYYANSSSGWMNTEIALPNDDPMHSVKLYPSVVMNDSVIHAVWLHHADPYDADGDVYYGTSLNWSQAIPITDYEGLLEAISVGVTQEALAVDSTGTAHVVWCEKGSVSKQINGDSENYELHYATIGKAPVDGSVGGVIVSVDTRSIIAPIIGLAIALCSLAAYGARAY